MTDPSVTYLVFWRDGILRKDELMEASIKFFAEKGHHRTNITVIVQEAGVALRGNWR